MPAAPRRPARLPRAVAAVALGVTITAAGVGWLYLLRHVHAVAVGPHLGGALPLQRLAGDDAQPLLRVILTWVPAGIVGGAALSALTGLGRPARALAAAAGAFVVLAAAGAVSDAITANEPLAVHVGGQLRHDASWIAAALVAAGALTVPPPRRRLRRSAPRTDATRPSGAGPAAA